MDHSLAKELKVAGFPQDGKDCETYTNINDSTLVERVAHPTLSELIEACPKQLGTATFVLGSRNQGQAWVACYFDFRANREGSNCRRATSILLGFCVMREDRKRANIQWG